MHAAPPPSAWAGVALIAVSASAFGAMAIFARAAAASGADIFAMLLFRFFMAAILLLVWCRLQRVRFPARRRALGIALMGGVGYVGQSLCFFGALQYAQASLVALLLYLYPVFVTILAAIFLHERLTPVKLGALLLCSLGTALTVGGGHGQPLGMALAVAAALIYSGYIVVGARLTKGVDARATATLVCLAATVSFGAMAAVRMSQGLPLQWPAGAGGWAALVAIAVCSTVIAILTFFAGLQRLGAGRASMLSTLEPVVTVLLAAMLLGETLSAAQLGGGVLILAGVVWLSARGAAAAP
ncbi:DMT family transporter [Pandoraea apista]|uniref:DMT family transporter n=1 Tax=Pandoraea apista TaxID=93218 RepID=A0ABX9ZUJ9_9BURK|nr:DMT family transporter [Pandoraea apista]PTE03147.1 EamA family transporter [Pandoraea apista]RRJ27618.1 DMT family transporter [Pandoraea apista]RRJ81257.1 DMT family transporter [Pandoraea apista]RSD18948.1 DMT family transporter [Pandoraea apista]RSD23239.1 DMT family transporter [Pandoraea apista]